MPASSAFTCRAGTRSATCRNRANRGIRIAYAPDSRSTCFARSRRDRRVRGSDCSRVTASCIRLRPPKTPTHRKWTSGRRAPGCCPPDRDRNTKRVRGRETHLPGQLDRRAQRALEDHVPADVGIRRRRARFARTPRRRGGAAPISDGVHPRHRPRLRVTRSMR